MPSCGNLRSSRLSRLARRDQATGEELQALLQPFPAERVEMPVVWPRKSLGRDRFELIAPDSAVALSARKHRGQ